MKIAHFEAGSGIAGDMTVAALLEADFVLGGRVIRYLDHQGWVDEVASGAYRHWVETHYATREAAA